MKPFINTSQPANRGFTLLELLASVTITGILLALVLVSLRSVLGKSNEATCVSNLRQIGLASLTFASENNGYMPSTQNPPPNLIGCYAADNMIGRLVKTPQGWGGETGPLDSPKVLFCPAQKNVTYPDASTAYGRGGWAKEGYYAGYLFFLISKEDGTGDDFLNNPLSRSAGRNPLAMDFGVTLGGAWASDVAAKRAHEKYNNVLHMDGHVSQVGASAIEEARTVPQLLKILSDN